MMMMMIYSFLFLRAFGIFCLVIFCLLFLFSSFESFSLESEREQASSSLQDLLSHLADLNNDVNRRVSTRPFISISSNLRNNTLEIVQSAPIKIGITISLVFHIFFSSLARF